MLLVDTIHVQYSVHQVGPFSWWHLPLQTEQILSAIQNDPMHLAGRRVMLQEELVTMLAEAARTLLSETAAGQDQEGLLPKDLNTTVIFLDAMAR